MLDKPDKSAGRLWVDFYEAEKRLYAFLQTQNMLHCYAGCEPEYHEKAVLLYGKSQFVEAPPTYVRATIALNRPEHIKTFHELDQEVREKFTLAQEESMFKTTRPPARFPQYFENATQITLTVNEAVKSVYLDPEGLFHIRSCSLEETNPFEEEIDILTKAGIATRMEKTILSYSLSIVNESLYQFAQAEKLQHRKYTGSRYIARVRKKADKSTDPKPKAVRHSYGLLILNVPCPVYDTTPRSDRDDRLVLAGRKVDLPVKIIGDIWCRED